MKPSREFAVGELRSAVAAAIQEALDTKALSLAEILDEIEEYMAQVDEDGFEV